MIGNNSPEDFDSYNKLLLKQFRKILADLSLENDFLEISTTVNGFPIQLRIHGKANAKGNLVWQVVRVINHSIIPAEALNKRQHNQHKIKPIY